MFGLLAVGFVKKTLQQILDDIRSAIRANLGANIDLSADSLLSKIIGIVAERLAELWEGLQAVWSAADPDSATGLALERLAAMTGTFRLGATKTKVNVTLSGTPGTVVPTSVVLTAVGGAKFSLPAAATIGAGGTVSAIAEAVLSGPVSAVAGTVTTIDSPVSGLTTVTNPLDAFELGRNAETDEQLRIRRAREVFGQGGGGTVAAIRSKVLALAGVTDCFVFENVNDFVDANGLPPHSFECVVAGGQLAAIGDTVLATKPAGIATFGNTAVTGTDANGFSVAGFVSRPVNLPVWVSVPGLVVDPALWPADGAAQVAARIVAFGDLQYRVGSEVRASRFVSEVFKVPGVLECPVPFIGLAANPISSTTLQVSNRQLADLDTSRVTVPAPTFQTP